MSAIQIPPQLAGAGDEDNYPARSEWLATLPELIEEVASEWALVLSDPYLPGGQCAWVSPATDRDGDHLVLKVGWRHREAQHEADALRLWDGDGAVRCFATRTFDDTTTLLLERCTPGDPLKCSLAEPDQDVVIAGLLCRLWEHQPGANDPFGSLQEMCDDWASSFERSLERDGRGLDPGLAREGIAMLRALPRTAERNVLLCTDLHAGNVLASEREPWLVIDPKPFVGDPAFDAIQHMLNCDERLMADPIGLTCRMAELLAVDPERVRLWLFARCTQESLHDHPKRELARRLAP